jgi:hypothetical protein
VPWRGPNYDGEFPSLGWAVCDWAEAHFRVPDGPFAGERLLLTDEQATIIVRFYGLDDRGRFLFRRAAVRRAQGWGKSPLLAVIGLAELAGPTRFAGWDAAGDPVGVAPSTPWVQIAAVSEDQTDNTYAALHAMAADSDLAGTELDVGLTRVFLKSGGRLEPVTAAAGTRLGQRVTFAVLDETHLWLARNGGIKLAATIRRNAGKMNGRTFESTNAHLPGEDSVAERTWEAADRGAAGLLYDSVEAPEVEDLSDRAAVLAALEHAYRDARWVDRERLADEIADPGTDGADARRFYFNQLVKGTSQGVDPIKWAGLAQPDRLIEDGTYIGVGFDGSISDDYTALVGCTPDGHKFVLGLWERPDGARDWRVPRAEVNATVADVFRRFRVGRMLCDPPKWETDIERWAQEHGEDVVLAFPTFSYTRFSRACDRFATAVDLLEGSHDGDPRLTAHVLAMGRKKVRVTDDDGDGRTRFVFVKADVRKIDAGIAAALAEEAAMTMPELQAVMPLGAWR